MSNTNNTPINQDQSNKSQNGRDFNINVTDHLKAWQDGKVRILVGKEVEIFCKKMVNIDQHQWFRVKFDNVFAIILTSQQEVILVTVDNTTTIRERTSQKALEGVSLRVLQDALKDRFLETYPQFSGYDFSFSMTLGIPDHLSPSLKNLLSEEKTVHETIIGINYKTDGDWSSNKYKDGLDFAARLSDITAIADHIIANQHRYIIDGGLLARVWVELYGTTYENMPVCSLNLSKANRQRDYLIWGLENCETEYKASELNEFLNIRGIKHNKSASKTKKIQLIIQDLKTNFPPQVNFDILKDVETYHEELRLLGKI